MQISFTVTAVSEGLFCGRKCRYLTRSGRDTRCSLFNLSLRHQKALPKQDRREYRCNKCLDGDTRPTPGDEARAMLEAEPEERAE